MGVSKQPSSLGMPFFYRAIAQASFFFRKILLSWKRLITNYILYMVYDILYLMRDRTSLTRARPRGVATWPRCVLAIVLLLFHT